MVRRIVVVGAGTAGMQTVLALRGGGYQGELRLVGAEPREPYDRPPLSKDVLLGKAEHSRFEVDYAELDVELLLGRRALAVDPARRTVRTAPGDGTGPELELEYDRLVLATGARPVSLPGQPASAHLLRTHDDAVALRAALRPGARVVIVGAGWIGAEAATVARQLGCAVTVVEAAATPLPGALPPEVGEPMRAWYAGAGVELRTGSGVSGFAAGAVLLADGSELAADVVLVGIGARPETGWLAGSGIALDERGAVAADDRLRTSADGVFAVGDCASFPSDRYRTRLTVHHWDNAMRGPEVAAANALGGDERYDPVPYFWSEQFGRMVQYAGQHRPGDELLWRGDPGGPGWSALWLRGDVPVALLAVDRPRDLAQGRRLVERATPVDRVRAADPAVPLKEAVGG
ncbi:NAD(P)/FAD-dependent oxidoreductase [Streptacidiphilus sp. P02-A3a]|uniref:NAD(P)/FAD-dependent oxidoreductase n=1 Tax=Streptacidiphilus sp. P02-A3a TaxID=2704468 RepID=UPI0015F8D9A4|nr:FAD-dependent oxidoreductase [Streptacidiphilus sp. P02-A3a]QMU68547.1 oxidoreductase [Streptacidiphilus sp. P02-A3a]